MNLLKTAFLISIIGIFTLLLLSNILEPKTKDIKDITKTNLNKEIKIKGNITKISNYDNFQIITLNDSTGKIKAIINKNLNLTPSQKITITGTLTTYKNTLQIQANKITS